MKRGDTARYLAILALACARPSTAAEFRGEVVDSLGHPIEGVEVVLDSDGEDVTARTDANGRYTLVYPDSLDLDDAWFRLEKSGYSGYSSSSPDPRFEMRRKAEHTIVQIARMPVAARTQALRHWLASDLDDSEDEQMQQMFEHGASLRAPLRRLLDDPAVRGSALWMLASIGTREDVQYVLAHAPAFVDPWADENDGMENRWAYAVATSLVEPRSEAEWRFLEACASGKSDDGWVDAGAILALSLSRDPRAIQVLQRAAKANPGRRAWIERRIAAQARLPAAAVEGADPGAMAAALAPHLGFDSAGAVSPARYTTRRDLAEVPMSFRQGMDLLEYSATFAKGDGGRWWLTGVRETGQALLAE